MKVELLIADSPELIMNMFQYYIYDMSEYTKFAPNANGTYTVDESVVQLSTYWKEPDHYPFLIKVDDEIAGFSLIREFPFKKGHYDVGQFFVLRKYKGLGIGRIAFNLSVRKFPGKWITRVLPTNDGAFKFWKKVISDVAVGCPVIKKEMYMGKEMIYFNYIVEKDVDELG